MKTKRFLTLFPRGGARWRFLEENRSVVTAGNAHGRATSDGRGKLYVNDTGDHVTGSGLGWVIDGGESSWGNPKIAITQPDDSGWPVTAGDMFVFGSDSVSNADTHLVLGCRNATTDNGIHDDEAGLYEDKANLAVFSGNPALRALVNGESQDVAMVVRGLDADLKIIRYHFLEKINNEWKLVWPGAAFSPLNQPTFPGVHGHTKALTVRRLGLIDLVANGKAQHDTAFDAETDSDADLASGETFTIPPNGHSGKVTMTPDGSLNENMLQSCFIDAQNRLLIYHVNGDDDLHVAKEVNNVVTALGSKANVFTASTATGITWKVSADGYVTVWADNVLAVGPVAIGSGDDVLLAATQGRGILQGTSSFANLITHPINLGTATDRVICPQPANEMNFLPDSILDVENVTLTTGDPDFHFFRGVGFTDPFAYSLRINADGSVAIVEYDGVTDPTRISGGAGTVSDGSRVVVIADGANIELIVDTASVGTYGSALYQTQSGYKRYTAAGGSCDSVTAWPRNLTAAGLMPKGV
ncbi:MAG: hypothetical protein GY906_11540 [bacterium]|nr:hypothetical protein [bacterium]